MKAQDSPLQILLAEDNPVDILVTRQALEDWDIQHNLHVVEDGKAAINFLLRRGIYDQVERPDLVLLDLNLPRKSGAEVLAVIRQDPDLSHIMVAVITTSGSEEDLQQCHDLGVKIVVTKPLDFDEYVQEIKAIQGIWDDSRMELLSSRKGSKTS